VKLTFEEKTS